MFYTYTDAKIHIYYLLKYSINMFDNINDIFRVRFRCRIG